MTAVIAARAPLEELGAMLAAGNEVALDDGVRAAARHRVFDTLGAARLGLATLEGAVLCREAERRLARADVDAAARCRLPVAAARTTEIDDIDVASCTTVGAVVVPVSLAVAAESDAADAAALQGVVAGYEAMTRLGRAIGGATLLYRGVWPTYVTAAFGAAAAAARVLGHDAHATSRSLALALQRSNGAPAAAFARLGFRYFALGCAAADGVLATAAAAAGVEPDSGALAAFGARLGVEIDARQLCKDLGIRARVHDVDVKPFPTARQALASVAAFLDQAPEPCASEDIESIVVRVPAPYRDMIDRAAWPAHRVESLLGVQYQIALAARGGAALYDALRGSLPHDAATAALMRKIEVVADEGLTRRFPAVWGSAVAVRWRSGRTTSAEVLEPRGCRGADFDAVAAKLHRVFSASGVETGVIATLAERCARFGERGARGMAAALLEPIEAVARAEHR